MNNIEINKVIVDGNIRTDYGDLTELSASIKEHGIRTPIQLNAQNILIDGHRRLKAAKAAGLIEIPYFVNNEVDKTTSQILAGIFQKNLNPVEEGNAYNKYLALEKITVETLAKKISKNVDYITKRLLLVDISKDVQEALIKKKILIGHALLLAKLPKTNASGYLKKIIRDDKGVQEAKEDIQYGGFAVMLSEAPFCKSECKHCKFNGSEQAELFETGTILNNKCMDPKCYHKKVVEFVKQAKEKFKEILYSPEDDYDKPKGYLEGTVWDREGKGITDEYMKKCRKSKENYLVKIRDDGRMTEYFKVPTKEVAPGEESKTQIKEKEIVRQDKLLSRVNEFKTDFLIKKSIELMKPGTKEAKVLTLIKLMRDANWDDLTKEFNKIVGGEERSIKKIYKLKEAEIDKAISYLSRRAFKRIDLKELIIVSRNFKVDVKKHFGITKEYLELYTKEQLWDLIEEFKFCVDADDPKVKTITTGNIKKGDLIQHILNQNLKGRVPKIMI